LFLGFGDLDFCLSHQDGHNCAHELFVKGNLIFGGVSFWAAESREIHLSQFSLVLLKVRDIQQVWKLHQLPPKLKICGLMTMSLLCHSPKGRQSSHLLLVSKPGGFFDFSYVK
jgi:hypothetical protein